jgi:hypothetical protein
VDSTKKRIGFILRDPVDWTAVIAFYRIFIVVILAVAVASCHGNRGFPVGHPFMHPHGRRQFFLQGAGLWDERTEST